MSLFFFRAFAAAALLALPWAAQADDYLTELQRRAREANLAQSRQWHDLVHYRPDLLMGSTSLADSPSFFNAPEGKTDPQAELDATLAAFFDVSPDPSTRQPRQCRFVARYQWLKSQLQFDPVRLPEQACERFDAWYGAIAPRQVTLIYPAAFLNGPSSMFGHTLLRIDSKDHPEDTQLFSYALNFAAATDDTNGLVFAVKGLFGGYPGYFSTAPYYEKVKEYNDLENRDIWEYELNYTPEEVRRLLEHAWELGQVNFDYFFFKENCSYQLLALMDVARPGHNLVDRFRGWAIPSDTVRVILAEEGLLQSTRYRASNLTRIRHERAALTPSEQDLALSLAKGDLSRDAGAEIATERQAVVLDLAYDYLQYRAVNENLPRTQVAGPSMNLLRRRVKLPSGHLAIEIATPPDRPDLGHGTARLALGVGRRGNEDYLEIRLRPAYHDLVDPPAGYTQGAQINFLDIVARAKKGRDELELEAFRVVDIFSVTGRDDFFHPWSWRISAAVERSALLGMKNPDLAPAVGGGGGVAYALGQKTTVFALADGMVIMSDLLPEDDYSVGAGPYAGVSVQDNRVTLLAGARTRYFSGVDEWMTEYMFESGLTLSRNLALRLGIQRTELAGENMTDSTLGLHGYF